MQYVLELSDSHTSFRAVGAHEHPLPDLNTIPRDAPPKLKMAMWLMKEMTVALLKLGIPLVRYTRHVAATRRRIHEEILARYGPQIPAEHHKVLLFVRTNRIDKILAFDMTGILFVSPSGMLNLYAAEIPRFGMEAMHEDEDSPDALNAAPLQIYRFTRELNQIQIQFDKRCLRQTPLRMNKISEPGFEFYLMADNTSAWAGVNRRQAKALKAWLQGVCHISDKTHSQTAHPDHISV